MTSTTVLDLTAQFSAAVASLGAVSSVVEDFRAVDDAALVSLSRLAAREKQLADAHLALIAGEIAARSTREMGHAGLAQREGFRSPEDMVKVTTGTTGREAVTAVRVGRLVRDSSGLVDPVTGVPAESAEPWLACVAAAVSAGRLSVGAADAIRAGLGVPTENVSVALLADAAAVLCGEAAVCGEAALRGEAAGLDVDRLVRRAREVRDDLDAAGVADRERERFESRSLKHYRLSSGMGRLVWDLDPESYAVVTELYDRAASPKRGVRFVSGSNKDVADQIVADPRTVAQLASDTLLGLLQAGAAADPSRMIGTGAATVRILVPRNTLATTDGGTRGGTRGGAGADGGAGGGAGGGTGIARMEGSPDPVTAATAARLACDGSTIVVTVDTFGSPLDVGDEHRLFTPKQRIALAVRDGACMWGDCTTPPSLSEAHHIIPWSEGGTTDLDNGILLCKFHHLLIHNNGWHIERIEHTHYLIPPPDIDPDRTPRPMPSKSAALRDLEHVHAHAPEPESKPEPEREAARA